jgi:predicted GH43/DUF377 family glycosyl hydrolase
MSRLPLVIITFAIQAANPMPVTVNRSHARFQPDASRVIARFFYASESRSLALITNVLEMPPEQKAEVLARVMVNYSNRHRDIDRIFDKHFNLLLPLFRQLSIDGHMIARNDKQLLGAYFTMEYSIEAAAFFNPSMMEHPDQSGLAEGSKRIIISFRATGEGHISSVVFRTGVIDSYNHIHLDPPGKMLESPEHIRKHKYHRTSFVMKLDEMQVSHHLAYQSVTSELPEVFTYEELRKLVDKSRILLGSEEKENLLLNEIMWLASSHYDIEFSKETLISERVIFPIAETEVKGIEDARFVRFTEAEGMHTYYATYTAFDGNTILPKLLLTRDFRHFTLIPVNGEVAQNKGMALFPRMVNGKYAMLCRTDGVNNYIAYSDKINMWRYAKILQYPSYTWEFVQIGNCGSPIEIPEGWLMITHGVGPMREYVLGISLLDLDNPEKVIGRLTTPLLVPNTNERDGYVPNVVYSCGSMIHGDSLIIPYAMSDYASSYATINVKELVSALLASA